MGRVSWRSRRGDVLAVGHPHLHRRTTAAAGGSRVLWRLPARGRHSGGLRVNAGRLSGAACCAKAEPTLRDTRNGRLLGDLRRLRHGVGDRAPHQVGGRRAYPQPPPRGGLMVLVGSILLGAMTLYARVLPWWCGVLLIAGSPLGAFLETVRSGIENIVFAIVWGLIGYALLSRRGMVAEQQP
jgi:hypothetical protein